MEGASNPGQRSRDFLRIRLLQKKFSEKIHTQFEDNLELNLELNSPDKKVRILSSFKKLFGAGTLASHGCFSAGIGSATVLGGLGGGGDGVKTIFLDATLANSALNCVRHWRENMLAVCGGGKSVVTSAFTPRPCVQKLWNHGA
jgi:hypothetical protein